MTQEWERSSEHPTGADGGSTAPTKRLVRALDDAPVSDHERVAMRHLFHLLTARKQHVPRLI